MLYPPDSPGKRTVMAHRLVWETFWRRPLVNKGLHGCNNPPCCNPLHVYDGTLSQNTRDSFRAGTANFLRPDLPRARGEANARSKLTDAAVSDIRRRYAAGGVSQQDLADEYGIQQSQISRVIRRTIWQHVE